MRIGCPPHPMAEPSDPSEHPHTCFEPADADRPASATPTEAQLERETPTIARLDRSPPPPRHDPYAALRMPTYRYYAASYALAIVGGQMESVAVAWQIFDKTRSEGVV